MSSTRSVAPSASEIEFQAEHELVGIVPHFTLRDNDGLLNLISGDFGPFQAGMTTAVPLWLAVMLKQQHKCRIMAPSWLSVEYLTQRLEQEKQSNAFEELPYHYLEVSSLLFQHAADDIDQVEHIRSLIEDLQNIRQDKIRNGLYRISNDVQTGGTAYAVQLNNISAMEINSVRKLMTSSLNQFYELVQLREVSGGDDMSTQSSSQVYSDQRGEGTPVQRLRRFRND